MFFTLQGHHRDQTENLRLVWLKKTQTIILPEKKSSQMIPPTKQDSRLCEQSGLNTVVMITKMKCSCFRLVNRKFVSVILDGISLTPQLFGVFYPLIYLGLAACGNNILGVCFFY